MTVAAEMTTSPKPRSGGPRTVEGKLRSRCGALKHGLRARVVFPDELADLIARRTDEMRAEWKPETPYQEWLVGEAGRASAQVERCGELAVADLRRLGESAAVPALWAAERRLEAEALGARLTRDPGRVVEALGRTPQGTDWLIQRWGGLAEAARRQGHWDEPQRTMALDLLGVPAELRSTALELPTDAPAADLIALAEEWVSLLEEEKRHYLNDRDESERGLVILGLPLKEDAATARLRRYENACRRTLQWALGELRRLRPEPEPVEPKTPKPKPKPKAVIPRDAARPHPASSVVPPLLRDAFVVRDEPITPPAPAARPASASPPLNRRARRAQEKQARRAAKHSGRTAAPAR